MAYLLSNICTKNYWNRTTIVEIIVSDWVGSFFEIQCMLCAQASDDARCWPMATRLLLFYADCLCHCVHALHVENRVGANTLLYFAVIEMTQQDITTHVCW